MGRAVNHPRSCARSIDAGGSPWESNPSVGSQPDAPHSATCATRSPPPGPRKEHDDADSALPQHFYCL